MSGRFVRLSASAATAFAVVLARPALGNAELLINEMTDKIQQSSSVAMDAKGNFVVAWQSEVEGAGDEIRARIFDARGVARGGEIAVNTLTKSQQNAPSVAMDAQGDFVIAWQSLGPNNTVIRARRFDAVGVPKGGEIAVNARPGGGHAAPTLAMGQKGSFVLAWESAIQGSYEIRARRFDAEGAPLGEEFSVNTDTLSSQRFPALAADARGNFVVVWRSNVAGSFEIRARRFRADGQADGGEIAVNTVTAGDQLAPSVAAGPDGDFVVAWENSFQGALEVRARRFSARGTALGDEFAVNAATAGNQFAPAVAMSKAGDFVIAWHNQSGRRSEMRARTFAASGHALGDEIAVQPLPTGAQRNAAVAADADGDFVITWHTDVRGTWDVAAQTGRIRRKLWKRKQ